MKIMGNGSIPAYPKIRGEINNLIYPCYAESKLDGEANIYYRGTLTSKASGKIRRDCPITSVLEKACPLDIMLFGELFWGQGLAGALYDFLSHAKDDDLKFAIFDLYHPTLIGKTYEDRREYLIANIQQQIVKANPNQTSVYIIRPAFIPDSKTLYEYCDINKKAGFEGVVAKNKDSVLFDSQGKLIQTQTGWVKIKHKTTGDYHVQNIDPIQERMEVNVNGRLVGVKLINKYKPLVKLGDLVEIEHMGVLSGGGLRHPVFRGKVVK